VRPIAVIGPTGTGKSQLALQVAERLGGEIGVEVVNADAMQQYRGMDIGTAKLSVAERHGIAHHQLDVLDVTQTATVARYQEAAAADVEAIAARGAVPVIVGGSMLYIQSLLDDWAFPATDPQVRARWEELLAEIGVTALHAELGRRDPAAAAAILATDGRRIVRALEVIQLTGQPFAASAPRIGAPRWGHRDHRIRLGDRNSRRAAGAPHRRHVRGGPGRGGAGPAGPRVAGGGDRRPRVGVRAGDRRAGCRWHRGAVRAGP
jgi:tRNA dimethylallyltransferase